MKFKQILPVLAGFLACLQLFASNTAEKPEGDGTVESPYQIWKIENLVWMNVNMGGCMSNHFVMTGDIDAAETRNWEIPGDSISKGFVSIGSKLYASDKKYRPFRGSFDGRGHAIRNLYSEHMECSLFRKLENARVCNLYLENAETRHLVGNKSRCGFLALSLAGCVVSNCHVHGVSDRLCQAGLSYDATDSVLCNCSFGGTIRSDLSASSGLVNFLANCRVAYCKAFGEIKNDCLDNGSKMTGGLFAYVQGTCRVEYCHADMKLESPGYVGGLAGRIWIDTEAWTEYGLRQCYSSCTATLQKGSVSGGLFGAAEGKFVCDSCYYDKDGLGGGSYGSGVKREALYKQATFSSWDFSQRFGIQEGQTMPYFKIFGEEAFELALLHSCQGKLAANPQKSRYAYGEKVAISAIPESKCIFKSFWGTAVSKETELELEVGQDYYVAGNFARLISSPEDFLAIGSESVSPSYGNYEQACDIDMGTNVLIRPFFHYNYSRSFRCLNFTGVYDGQGHGIFNLQLCPERNAAVVSVFGSAQNAILKNAAFVNLKVEAEGPGGYGTVFSDVRESVVSNCTVEGSVTLNNVSSTLASGGLCYYARNSAFCKSGFKGDVRLTGEMAGLAGKAEGCSFSQCGVEMKCEGMRMSGLAGEMHSSKLEDCYVKGDLSNFSYVSKSNDSASFFNYGISNTFLRIHSDVAANHILAKDIAGSFSSCYFNSNLLAKVDDFKSYKSAAEMKQAVTYSGWDFNKVWAIEEGLDSPALRSVTFPVPEPICSLGVLGLAFMAWRRK